MKTTNLKKLFIAAVLIGISTTLVHAEKPDTRAKLAKPLKIELKDVTIAEALEKIGQKADINFVLSDQAVWKLPHGEATRLSVALQGPLAESMREMLNAFFMRYAVSTEQITIYPRPELDHILGKPTIKQLELLKVIYTKLIIMTEEDDSTIDAAQRILGQNIAISPYRLSDLVGHIYGSRSRPLTFASLLEEATLYDINPETDPLKWRNTKPSKNKFWYLVGPNLLGQTPEIRVVFLGEFRKAKLNQIVDISFDESAETIIQRLANWTGLELYIEKLDSNWLQEPLSVEMQNITLKQALTNIVTMVDGKIVIDRGYNFIEIKEKPHPRKPSFRTGTSVPPCATNRRTTATTRSSTKGGGGSYGGGKLADNEYVGKISVPMEGGKYFIEFMLRQSDLTDELIKLRQQKITDILGEPPKPKPTTAAKPTPPKKDD